jgi:hypothetical protein
VIWAGARLRRLALAVCVAYGGGLGAEMAVAVEPASGSRNFTAPRHVPNYFSNETAPFRGASGGQTASPGNSPVVVIPRTVNGGSVESNRHARQKSVQAGRHRARLARGKVRRGQAVHARLARGGKAVVARRGHSVAAKRKATINARRPAAAKAQGIKNQGGKTRSAKSQRVARAR